MSTMKRWTRRLKHLDRMACNRELTPDVQERFRLAAWDLRRMLHRIA